ncbi:hypothetical protein BDV10DRAFT_185028 [Aspergillus recurvatus]
MSVWVEAIGSIAHPRETGEPVTSSGIFKVREYGDYSHGSLVYGSFSTVSFHPGCFSAVPHTPSTGCTTEYPPREVDIPTTPVTLNGTTTTVQLLMPMTTVPSTTLVETAFRGTEHLIVMSQMGPIYLVRQPSDVESKTSAPATSVSDQDTTNTDAEGTSTNAASALRMDQSESQSAWGQLVGIASTLTLSVLVGMALVLPW